MKVTFRSPHGLLFASRVGLSLISDNNVVSLFCISESSDVCSSSLFYTGNMAIKKEKERDPVIKFGVSLCFV